MKVYQVEKRGSVLDIIKIKQQKTLQWVFRKDKIIAPSQDGIWSR